MPVIPGRGCKKRMRAAKNGVETFPAYAGTLDQIVLARLAISFGPEHLHCCVEGVFWVEFAVVRHLRHLLRMNFSLIALNRVPVSVGSFTS